MSGPKKRERVAGMMRMFGTRWFIAAAACVAVVLLAAGCLSLTNHSQSCTSSGGALSSSEFSCSGSAGTVQGGRMDVYANTVDGGREGGEVSPGNPIRIQAVVPSSDEDVSVTLSVKGGEEAEVGGLSYEAAFTEAN